MDYRLNLESPWHEVRQMIQEINIDLTDEDLEMEPNGERELLHRLAAKMNKDVISVKAWIESVSHNNGVAG
ncbi:MAG: hypothetical protein ACM3VS_07005 [Candidatus Dadabacteria bacterium]